MKIPGYTLKRKLGQGGMAAVYLAEQESFGREVALKIMAPQFAKESGFAERFQREARTVANLAHPHIITVHDVGVFQNFHYFAMEYHTGGDLTARLRNGVSVFEALRIVQELADALDFAHQRGIIHRDIKPDNVLFHAHNNAAILSDFGIAKSLEADSRLTQIGSTVGTPKYMSPEQARGQQLDGRADLYSLGVMLYELLTGVLPYQAEEAVALAMKHCQDPIPVLRGDLVRYQGLINRLLAKTPEGRYANGAELIAAIQALIKPQGRPQPAPALDLESTLPPASPRPSNSGARQATPSPASSSGTASAGIPLGIEESTKGKFPFKRYGMQARFSAEDMDDFRRQLQKLQGALREWLEKRGKKADSLHVSVQTHPWIQGRIKETLAKLRQENTPLATLLDQAEVRFHVYDEQDTAGQEWILSQAGGKPAKATPTKA